MSTSSARHEAPRNGRPVKRRLIRVLAGSAVIGAMAVGGLQFALGTAYAAGDVCGLSGIWPNAMKQGVIAAKNMYGIPTPYEDTYAMKNTMNFFGLPALCIGDINCLDNRALVITEEDSKNHRKALVEDGVLKSILMVGNISGSGIYQYLIKNQIKLPSADRSIFRLSFADFYGFDTSKGSYTWDTDLCCG